MRVLHIHFGKEGGAERFFVNLAKAFSQRGVSQKFIIRPNRSWDEDIAALGTVIRNNCSQLSPLTLLLHLQINMLVKKWKPDVVMAWMPRAGRLLRPWPGVVKLARMGDFPNNLKHFGHCDVLVGNVPGIASKCYELGWQKPALTISNFPRPVSPVPVARETMDTPPEAIVVSASGRFVPRKGFDTLIRAVAQLPGVWLWLLGDGQERQSLENLASELGINGRIRFSGWIAEPIHHIAASDIFVMPSRHEPLGNTLLEAWQAGTPSISTRSEGPSWYMRDGIDGLMTEIDSVHEMAAALKKLIENASLRKSVSANAKERLSQMFSESAVVNEYLRVFSGDFTDTTF